MLVQQLLGYLDVAVSMRGWLKNRCGLGSLEATRERLGIKTRAGQVEKIQIVEADDAGFGTGSMQISLSRSGHSRQAGAAIATKGNWPEPDHRHSVNTQARIRRH